MLWSGFGRAVHALVESRLCPDLYAHHVQSRAGTKGGRAPEPPGASRPAGEWGGAGVQTKVLAARFLFSDFFLRPAVATPVIKALYFARAPPRFSLFLSQVLPVLSLRLQRKGPSASLAPRAPPCSRAAAPASPGSLGRLDLKGTSIT